MGRRRSGHCLAEISDVPTGPRGHRSQREGDARDRGCAGHSALLLRFPPREGLARQERNAVHAADLADLRVARGPDDDRRRRAAGGAPPPRAPLGGVACGVRGAWPPHVPGRAFFIDRHRRRRARGARGLGHRAAHVCELSYRDREPAHQARQPSDPYRAPWGSSDRKTFSPTCTTSNARYAISGALRLLGRASRLRPLSSLNSSVVLSGRLYTVAATRPGGRSPCFDE